MSTKIHTFLLDLDFPMITHMSAIDRFGGEWIGIAKREGAQTLKQLKSVATVESTGASTRIEGSRMTDDEVRTFLFDLKVEKLQERDQQEVKGYFHVLDIIIGAYNDIDISETSLKSLHNELMRFSAKDEWHKGDYKQHSNSVERTNPDGSKTIVFDTTPPGVETEDAMRALVNWYNEDRITPPLIKSAIFVYDFLSIHPFQDGNGRLSRLLGTLLLLKNGYPWIEYVSFEHEIENRKAEYYRVLVECQGNRPGENVSPWLNFFLDCMTNIQEKLRKKLSKQKRESQIPPREKKIFTYVDNHPGCNSSEISEKLAIPLPTVKRILADMVAGGFLTKHGAGPGTNYTTERVTRESVDVTITFHDIHEHHEFVMFDRYSSMTLKKIILNPKFEWKKPDDWATVLLQQGLCLRVICHDSKGGTITQLYYLGQYNTPYHFQPVFTIPKPIQLPLAMDGRDYYDNAYPVIIDMRLQGNESELKFDVMIVYDALT
ncbi:MAG: Fic family protein [Bacteroidia bacterium]|nr:Fic family protein [Bacteroidia bacterium]